MAGEPDPLAERATLNPVGIGLGLFILLIPVTLYEVLLVGLDTYGYGLTRRSSYLIFFNAFLLATLVESMFRLFVRIIGQSRILRPEGWMSVCMGGSLVALYWAWAVDRWLRVGIMRNMGAELSLSPATLVDYMAKFHEYGLWGWGNSWYFDHRTVAGTALTVWWILEASFMILVPAARTWRFLSSHPQCSRCGGWMQVQQGLRRMQGSRASRVQEGLRSGNYGVLEEPDTPQKGDPFTLRIDLARCDLCRDAFYLCLVHDQEILLWLHPFPADQVPKVFKPVRAAGGRKGKGSAP
jgi:hypothetical protein